MPTPSEIMAVSSSAMNDTAQETYNNITLLPYLNMAMDELIERMEENDLPTVTKQSSDPISIAISNTPTKIEFQGTPQLPADLIELEEVWESNDGGTTWTPLSKVDYINPNISSNQNSSFFGQYAWNGDHIEIPGATSVILLKLMYIRRIIQTPLNAQQIEVNIPIINCKLFLAFKTAAFAAMLINQDTERASILQDQAEEAIERQMNIPIKGQQSIYTRRKPFRAGYKSYGRSY